MPKTTEYLRKEGKAVCFIFGGPKDGEHVYLQNDDDYCFEAPTEAGKRTIYCLTDFVYSTEGQVTYAVKIAGIANEMLPSLATVQSRVDQYNAGKRLTQLQSTLASDRETKDLPTIGYELWRPGQTQFVSQFFQMGLNCNELIRRVDAEALIAKIRTEKIGGHGDR